MDYKYAGDQSVSAANYHHLTLSTSGTKTLCGDVTVAGDLTGASSTTCAVGANTLAVTGGSDIDGTLSISTGTTTVTGSSDIDGTLSITNTGTYDANGTFDATNGAVTFTGAGNLKLGGATVTSLGTLSSDNGTVWYDRAGDQTVLADSYYSFQTGGSETKTLGGALDVDGNLTIGSGTTLSTSDSNYAISLAGNWSNSGTFTPGTGTVTFDGTSTITSGGTGAGKPFYNVTLDGTSATLATNPIKIDGALTINSSNTFALAGNDCTSGSISNSGTFQMNGDEALTTTTAITGGLVKFVDTEGCTLTTSISGLPDVEFDSNGKTFTLSEDMTYITGDITLASGTTLTMGGYDMTLADGKTVTNNGTWTAPTSGSVFTCSGDATFAGDSAVNFYDFSSTTASAVLIFEAGKTYEVDGTLTLLGADANVIDLKSSTGGTQFTIRNDGNTESVSYVKVTDCAATENNIDATNSWAVSNVTGWNFGAIAFAATGTGNWDAAGTWDKGRVPVSTDNATINADKTVTLTDGREINDLTINGTLACADQAFTANGASDINGTLTISTGTYTANSSFDATGGSVTFSGAGTLNLAGTIPCGGLGTFTKADGCTVDYKYAGDQSVSAANYHHLTLSTSGTKTLCGDVTVAGDLTGASSTTCAVGANTLAVTGGSDIDGTLSISTGTTTVTGSSDIDGTLSITNTGTYDANGTFDATNGAVTFTGAGNLKLGGATVTSLGTLSNNNGTVWYDRAGDQTVLADSYYSFQTGGSETKTLGGALDVDGNLTIGSGTTLSISDSNYAISLAGSWTNGGTFTPGAGTVTFDGTSTVTTGGTDKPFYNVTLNGTSATLATNPIKIDGALMINSSNTFALAGNDCTSGSISNSGTFEMNGDETLTTTTNITGGLVKFVDASGCTLTTSISGLPDVEFDSNGNTFTLSEDMTYITGDITLASGTTLTMGGYDMTLADGKTVTNNGTWTAPTSGSVFTCSGDATFAGDNAVKFYDFSSTTPSAVLIFEAGKTYEVDGGLTLTGTNGNEIDLKSSTGATQFTIRNDGNTESVSYVKVTDCAATENNIDATNSWAVSNVTGWNFGAIAFAATGTGNWTPQAPGIKDVFRFQQTMPP